MAGRGWGSVLAVVALLALPAAARAADAPGAPGDVATVDDRRQGRRRHLDDAGEQGLADAQRRRADRGLRPRPRHAERARPAVRRHRRLELRRARARGRDPRRHAGRPAQPHLPPGRHVALGALADHEDLRDRPGALGGARRRRLRVADRPAAAALRAARPGAVEHRRRRHRRQRRPHALRLRRPQRGRARLAARAGRSSRPATSARATAGPTCKTDFRLDCTYQRATDRATSRRSRSCR